MLQQTQVGTVIGYFERFVARFPDVRSLAAASIDDVLSIWSGLGYYARARNLHAAAGIVVGQYSGELPKDLESLIGLPGIGRSTAAAILALSHGERHPILDGNVKRVLARFHAVEGWSGKSAVERELWQLAEQHTPQDHIAEYTQAIMDLGATVCRRGQPACEACPVAVRCEARKLGIASDLPTPRPRVARPSRGVTVLVVRNGAGEVLLERRAASGIWGGLLSFPELGDDEAPGEWCHRRLGSRPATETRLEIIEHAFTHFDLTLQPVLMTLANEASAAMDDDKWLWYNSAEPLPGGVAAPIGKLLREVAEAESLQ